MARSLVTTAAHALALLMTVLHVGLSPAAVSASNGSTDSGNPPSSTSLSDWFCGEPGVEVDYIKLPNRKDNYYFYWFTPSRSANASSDPLVVWLNGGPGSSSLIGLLAENGPCLVQPDLSLKRNPYAWNNNANVIYLEQPSGVGFSYYTDSNDREVNGEDVAYNMYAFLDLFMDKHPEFVSRPLYLTGQSYAGHYIPAAAYHIWSRGRRYRVPEPTRVNLHGIAIGNPSVNLGLQYRHMHEIATNNNYNLTLLTEAQISQMKIDAKECEKLLAACAPHSDDADIGCLAVSYNCDDKMQLPFLTARRNVWDMRQPCVTDDECFDGGTGVVPKFLELNTTRAALKSVVQDRVWDNGDLVNQDFLDSGDWARVYMKEIATLLNDGVRVLIYAGDTDLRCDWLGNRAWTLELEWKGKKGYNAAAEAAFTVPVDPLGLIGTTTDTKTTTTIAGSKWSFDAFTFLRVSEAGHMVPMDQPLVSYVMIDRFLKNEPI